MRFQKFAWFFLLGALAELYVFVKVAAWMGFLPMVLLAAATSMLGVVLLRLQGAVLGEKLAGVLARGELPAAAFVEGGVGWISAVLLIIPGFITDALGLIGMLPGVRRGLARRLLKQGAAAEGAAHPQNAGPRTIEGDFIREKDDP